MCGIVGFTGTRDAAPVIIDGLRRLEYRGYDSAGISILSDGGIATVRASGQLSRLCEKIDEKGGSIPGCCGIGHTRWATHGAPTEENAHPQLSSNGKFSVVHNGIIENFESLRSELRAAGLTFKSDTDTEVVANLLEYYYKGDFKSAVMKAAARLEGSNAVGVVCSDHPGVLFATRISSPLLLGVGVGESFFASDVTAFISYTKNVVYIDDGEFAELTPDGITVYDCVGKPTEKPVSRISWDIEAAEKGGFPHFMLKEIMEQPRAIGATISPRIKDGVITLTELDGLAPFLPDIKKIVITACGSAYHAGCIGKYLLEELCRIDTEIELASELRYRNPIIDEKTLLIVISQSGETADTIAALKEARSRGAVVLAIVNVVGSTIAKLADYVLYTHAGPEIAVATTKGYTTQLAALDMLAVWAASRLGRIDAERSARLTDAIVSLPERAQRAIDLNLHVSYLARRYHESRSLFFIGRNMDYAVCLEGSLKLKEISYIHSEAYAAGELKHGTIALISQGQLVVALACHDALFDKMMSNIKEVKARGARVLAAATEGDRRILAEADDVVFVPETEPLFSAIPEIVPLQLFAYYVADENGCDIDKPKNLAKSVTVE